jgi:hypothetical protein
MAQKVRMKIFERMKNGKRRHVLTIHGEGRTKRAAKANVKRHAKSLLRRNVQAGFYDSTGFHPIRASADYSAGRAGEKFRGGSHTLTAGAQKRYRKGRKARKGGALYSSHY